jgi:hypothetical protein
MMGMLPGFNSDMLPQGNDKASQVMIKRYITIIESMTDEELDTTNIKKLHEASRWAARRSVQGRQGHKHTSLHPAALVCWSCLPLAMPGTRHLVPCCLAATLHSALWDLAGTCA